MKDIFSRKYCIILMVMWRCQKKEFEVRVHLLYASYFYPRYIYIISTSKLTPNHRYIYKNISIHLIRMYARNYFEFSFVTVYIYIYSVSERILHTLTHPFSRWKQTQALVLTYVRFIRELILIYLNLYMNPLSQPYSEICLTITWHSTWYCKFCNVQSVSSSTWFIIKLLLRFIKIRYPVLTILITNTESVMCDSSRSCM